MRILDTTQTSGRLDSGERLRAISSGPKHSPNRTRSSSPTGSSWTTSTWCCRNASRSAFASAGVISRRSSPATWAPSAASSGVTVIGMRFSRGALLPDCRNGGPAGASGGAGSLSSDFPRLHSRKRVAKIIRHRGCREDQRMQRQTIAPLLAIGLAAAFCASRPACAQDSVASFYKGRTVTIVAASSPGGGYDLYARLIARVLGRHIPGHPSVVVTNMPGAASNVAAGHVYSVAPRDGSVIGALFMGAVVEPLFSGKTRPTHDMSRFQYIGNANRDVYVCLIRTDAPVKTFAQAMEREVVVGGTAEGASTRDFPMLLKNLLGVKFKVVSGYPGSREVNLAIERGEVQGGCGETWSSVAATYPAWFRDGTVKVLAQEDRQGYPELNRQGVPLTRDFAKTDEQRQILDLIYSQTAFGRPYVVAPDVPGERVDALRKAFMAAMTDPDLVAEARRIQVDVMPVAGEELQAIIATLYRTPKDLLDKARAAITGK